MLYDVPGSSEVKISHLESFRRRCRGSDSSGSPLIGTSARPELAVDISPSVAALRETMARDVKSVP
jgi:hypothetical protein